jgi:leucyl aminopeptidase (aminopeptidase T)
MSYGNFPAIVPEKPVCRQVRYTSAAARRKTELDKFLAKALKLEVAISVRRLVWAEAVRDSRQKSAGGFKQRMANMYEDIMTQKRAHTIVDLAQVQKGDKVLILCDYTTAEVGQSLAAQVYNMNALPILTIIPVLKGHSDSAPKPIEEMGMQMDVIIAPMKYSIAHSPLRTDALKAGIRFMTPTDILKTLASGAFDADYYALRDNTMKLAELLTKAKTARVTTAKGTDLTLSIEGREGVALTGFCQKGRLAAPPGMEGLCCPVEGTAEGKFICDVSVQGLPPELGIYEKILDETIEFVVHDGLVKEINGGAEARELDEYLKSMNDPTVFNIAELGVGTNSALPGWDGTMLDEALQGGLHIGLGDNVCFPGGKVESTGHFDPVMSSITLELDGKAIIKNGKNQY